MAFGAVFTTGDIGGGAPRTNFVGPILAGYPTGDPGSQTMQSSGRHSGSAAAPLYSFYNRPDMGMYGFVVTTSAAQLRAAVSGIDVLALSSAGVYCGTSSFLSTVGSSRGFFIPATTGTMVTSAGEASAPVNVSATGVGVYICYDTNANRLQAFNPATSVWLRQPSASAWTSS